MENERADVLRYVAGLRPLRPRSYIVATGEAMKPCPSPCLRDTWLLRTQISVWRLSSHRPRFLLHLGTRSMPFVEHRLGYRPYESLPYDSVLA